MIAAFELVLWAVRRELGREEDLAPLAAKVQDWSAVVDYASCAGVIPLMARTLGSQRAVPFAIRRELDRRYTVNAGRNALLARELRELVLEFRGEGIAALAYKGPALAVMAYGGVARRNPSSDIDLLLKGSDLFRAKELIGARGYRLSVSPEQEQHCLKHRYHLHFVRYNPEVHVELHWALTPAYWPFPLDYWSRTQEVTIDGAPVRTLDAEATLLALCAHGSKEGWRRLSQILDIGVLIQGHPTLDWNWVMAEAGRMKRERILRLGVGLASRWTGVRIPPPVTSFLAGDPGVSGLVREIGERLGGDDCLAGTSYHGYALRVWSRPADRLRYLLYVARMLPQRFRDLAAVGAEDRKLVDLPGHLSFLYFFIRPLRAVVQGGIGRFVWTFRRSI